VSFLRRTGRRDQDSEFVEFYEARAAVLRKTAFVLCGDWHLAEDLTQTTFTKLYLAWSRLDRHDQLDRYARQVLVRAFLDEGRRPWRREYATVPESPLLDHVVADRHSDERELLLRALAQVPKRRRAVLVLRYWQDLSVDQVAEILGCSSGTVRSQASRGLDDLRAALGPTLAELADPARVGRR
jgi:RNA polymerase sigma-70 factor (sigma-E family)